MALSSSFSLPSISKIDHAKKTLRPWSNDGSKQRFDFPLTSSKTELFGHQLVTVGAHLHKSWSFLGGLRVTMRPRHESIVPLRKISRVYASWLASSQMASTAFTFGTTSVLPFYALMVLAPKAELIESLLLKFSSTLISTKISMESSIPYIMLGVLYAYLLYLSWTPETLQLIFASKYWLPELPGIGRMFSNEMTLASAWIHLLVVDLFAARQVFRDGLDNEIETRHSVSLCLFFCPVGIFTHVITKALTKNAGNSGTRNMH